MVSRRRKRRKSKRSRRRARWLKIFIIAGVAALVAATVTLRGRQPVVRVTTVAETPMESLYAMPSSGIVPDGALPEERPLFAYAPGIDGNADIIPGESAAHLLDGALPAGVETPPVVVPEPLSLFLLGSGLLGILGFRNRQP